MRFLAWFLLFFFSLVLEVSVFPRLVDAWVPSISLAVLLLGFAHQKFSSGLIFAGTAGLLCDVLAPASGVTHTIFFLILFCGASAFMFLSGWEDPARRIGGIALALLLVPLAWSTSDWIGRMVFHLAPTGFRAGDIFTGTAVIEFAFAAVWFLTFTWISIRRSRIREHAALARLR